MSAGDRHVEIRCAEHVEDLLGTQRVKGDFPLQENGAPWDAPTAIVIGIADNEYGTPILLKLHGAVYLDAEGRQRPYFTVPHAEAHRLRELSGFAPPVVSHRRAGDVVVELEPAFVEIAPSSPGPGIIKIDGEPLPKVRGFHLSQHISHGGLTECWGGARLQIETIDEPVRLNEQEPDQAVKRFLDVPTVGVQTIRGYLVGEADWQAFLAWKRERS